MLAAVYRKASCILLITVNVKVNLLTALLMHTGLVHDWLKGDRRSRCSHGLSLSRPLGTL
jgi:hypothetical protein